MSIPASSGRVGLIAGSGLLPLLFADAARARGLQVVAIGHRGETDPSLASKVDVFDWVRLGQMDRILRFFRRNEVREAVMAGGIGRVRAFTDVRPDLGALRVISRLRSFGDDALLRGIAAYFEEAQVRIVAPTSLLPEVLAPEGHLGGPLPDDAARRDLEVGVRAATLLGAADVGQTVVVRNGHVLALEAVEGTDEAIRRGATYGGPGASVIKLSKPGQDDRFDLPAVGASTLEVMTSVGARLLALEAGRTIILDVQRFVSEASRRRITVLGVRRSSG